MIEAHHDEYGIIWPPSIAPYDVHLVALVRDEAAAGTAEEVYGDLVAAGVSVLYDDRNLSPGVMFADADLIGIPLRITVSQRSLSNGGVEVKWRHTKDREILALDGLTGRIAAMCEKTPR
jgi:prolyl-tRNA synthetase